MPAAVVSRDEAVERILEVFREHGYAGASLSLLSSATGLGRSSLYHHFPNGKSDMAAAAIEAVHAWFQGNVLSALSGEGSPEERLRRFAEVLAVFYKGGAGACLNDVFTIGEARSVFQRQLGEGMKFLMARLAAVAEDAGVARELALRRAEDAIVRIQGSLIVSRATGDTGPFDRVLNELPDSLIRPNS